MAEIGLTRNTAPPCKYDEDTEFGKRNTFCVENINMGGVGAKVFSVLYLMTDY